MCVCVSVWVWVCLCLVDHSPRGLFRAYMNKFKYC